MLNDDQIKSLMESVAGLEIREKEADKRLAAIEKRLDAQYEETVKIRKRLDALERLP
jgi:hypothetical protein